MKDSREILDMALDTSERADGNYVITFADVATLTGTPADCKIAFSLICRVRDDLYMKILQLENIKSAYEKFGRELY